MTIYHFHKLQIADIQRETKDSVSIVFDIPEELADVFKFTPGQHLVVRAQIQGEELRRNYSICSGVNDGLVRIAVKLVEGGRFSSYANQQLNRGDYLEVMPPEGSFHTPLDSSQSKNYLAFAAGSGITPLLSIIKSTLDIETTSCYTLVYGNKHVSSIMFREALLDLKNRYTTRLELIHILSREKQETELFNGRIDAVKLNSLCEQLIHLERVDECFICGPKTMMEALKKGLEAKGFPSKNIHFELFGNDRVMVASSDDSGVLKQVSVIVDGKTTQIELSEAGQTILDAALNAGADVPYACKDGVCCTCRGKVIEGEVKMDSNFALEEDELDDGFVLACQSHPVSETVILDFDER